MSSTNHTLIETLAADRDGMVDLTRDLIAIPTENPPGAHYGDALDLLTTRLEALGFDDTRIEGDCLVSFVGRGARTLYFSGHYDVVPAQRRDQFTPRLHGKTIVGLAFWTTELEPLERGYDGPIKILVGLDTRGLITGIVVAEHHEPYGNFSIEPPQFAAQFREKDVRDRFRVGADVDAVSRASITIGSATRAIRNSARRIARTYLTPPDAAK